MLCLFTPHFVLIVGIATTQGQDLALEFIEPYEVLLDPLLEPVSFSLDGIPFLRCVNCNTQLGIIGKLERVHSIPLLMSLIKMLKNISPKTNPLGDTTCHQSPPGHRVILPQPSDLPTNSLSTEQSTPQISLSKLVVLPLLLMSSLHR